LPFCYLRISSIDHLIFISNIGSSKEKEMKGRTVSLPLDDEYHVLKMLRMTDLLARKKRKEGRKG